MWSSYILWPWDIISIHTMLQNQHHWWYTFPWVPGVLCTMIFYWKSGRNSLGKNKKCGNTRSQGKLYISKENKTKQSLQYIEETCPEWKWSGGVTCLSEQQNPLIRTIKLETQFQFLPLWHLSHRVKTSILQIRLF